MVVLAIFANCLRSVVSRPGAERAFRPGSDALALAWRERETELSKSQAALSQRPLSRQAGLGATRPRTAFPLLCATLIQTYSR